MPWIISIFICILCVFPVEWIACSEWIQFRKKNKHYGIFARVQCKAIFLYVFCQRDAHKNRVIRFIQMVSKTISLQELTRTMCLHMQSIRYWRNQATSYRLNVCTPNSLDSTASSSLFNRETLPISTKWKRSWICLNTSSSKNERNGEEKRIFYSECPMFKPQI